MSMAWLGMLSWRGVNGTVASKYPRRPPEPDPEIYITEVRLAERFGCNRDTLYELRRQKRIPFMRVSNRIVYRIKDLDRIEQVFFYDAAD
ncbi:helix-turn-helix domain-containing protein [Actinoallomurus sp. CA-150999]|uniref:helix-turn-helix domain-containing protein n=1 Tax=Actinoallomurus sp. CA-150999 TaxID=3239887 RepID=UPI003D8FF810